MNLNNLSDLYKQFHGLKNIKEVGKKALLELEKRDPTTARMLCGMIYSKQDPASVIKQFANEGKINSKQIDKVHTAYNMLKKLGLKINVPDTTWLELQQLASGSKDLIAPKNRKGF